MHVLCLLTITGIPVITKVKERVEQMDQEKRSVSYKLIEGELLSLFKTFSCSFQVVPSGDACTVKWSVEYEKANDEVLEPNLIAEMAMKTFGDFDEYLLKN